MKIERLKIFTSDLERQLQFYDQVLGLEVLQVGAEYFEVQVGYSVLEFREAEKASPYHIAFHIEAYKEEQALSWLKERMSVLSDAGEEIVDFPVWNARSVYFYDADRNILEFIARRHCFSSETSDFTPNSIKGIGEIGIATTEVKKVYDLLNSEIGIEKYTGDYEVFCAMGDDEGLFIVINKDKKTWFPAGDKALASPFVINISNKGRTLALAYTNQRLELL